MDSVRTGAVVWGFGLFCVHMLEWKPEVDFRCLCQLLSYCVLRQGLFLTGELADSALLESPKGPLVSASPMQGSHAHATTSHLNMGAMELNAGPYACAVSALVTEPPPGPNDLFYKPLKRLCRSLKNKEKLQGFRVLSFHFN